VIDDGSSKDQKQKLEKLIEQDRRIVLIKNNINKGAGEARNQGLLKCSTEYLAFIDSDDEWDADFLKIMLQEIKNSDFDLIYCGYRRKYTSYSDIFLPSRTNNHHNILRGCDISCLATLLKIPENFNSKFGNLRSRNDLVFFYDFLKDRKARPIKKVLATYNILDKSLSRDKLQALKNQWIVNRVYAKNSYILSAFNCCSWALRGIVKYFRL